jgi:hypothetical protein
MALSKTDIANQALGRIGAQSIMSLDDTGTKAAIEAKRIFEATVKEVGRSAPWACLQKRVELAALSAVPAFEWAKQYQLPTDFLGLVQLNGYYVNELTPDDYEIEGRVLLTDDDEAKIKYTAYKEETGDYDSLFTNAIVVMLAAKLAMPIAQNEQMAANFILEFERIVLPRAMRKNAGKRKRRAFNPAEGSRWLSARRFSTNG